MVYPARAVADDDDIAAPGAARVPRPVAGHVVVSVVAVGDRAVSIVRVGAVEAGLDVISAAVAVVVGRPGNGDRVGHGA